MIKDRTIRWGILGTHWISGVVADAIHQADGSELHAVASRDAGKARDFAGQHAIPVHYDDYHALLTDTEVDAVYIGLPNHLHKEWMIHCAEAGKHILCEKPFVLDSGEARELIAVLMQHKVFCMEALMYRCHPFIHYLQALLADNIIGDIKFINAAYTANIAALANQTAGGAIRNLGCYPVSLARLLAGDEPVKISGRGELDASGRNDRFSSAIFEFGNGVMANIFTSDCVDMHWQFDVYGSGGILSVKTNPWLPGSDNRVLLRKNDKEETLHFTSDKSLYACQIEYCAEQIKMGQLSPDDRGVSWQHSLGNIIALEKWLAQIQQQSRLADFIQ